MGCLARLGVRPRRLQKKHSCPRDSQTLGEDVLVVGWYRRRFFRPRIGSRGSSRRVRQRPARMVSWKDRDAVVETLYRDVDALSPRLKDRRLIRRFAATRDYDPTRTLLLLVEYDKWLAKSGLLDDNLGRDPGVRDEMRRRGTMRLLDPRDAPAVHRAGASIEDAPDDERARLSAQRLTFLQLHTPSMWRTARDKDGCPAVYTNLESYRRGASKDVENTFVWILETVCREMDEDDAEDAAGEDTAGDGEGGRFTILLDASTCGERDFRAAAWIACCANLGRVLQTALKRGFRGRLNRFYVYPTGRAARSLLRIVKPFLGKYTPPKIVTVDGGERGVAKLVEVFGVDALPPHLGGRSELISVPLSEDDEPAPPTERREDENARENPPNAGTHPRRADPRGRRPRRDLDDYAWFLKVPILNFLLVAGLVASSAAPGASSRPGCSSRPARARRMIVRTARNAFAWHVIGSCLFGLEFSGLLSAGVSAVCATWREARRSRR